MRRTRTTRWFVAGAAAAATVVAACGGGSDSLYAGEMRLDVVVEGPDKAFATVEVPDGDSTRSVAVDTGSIYYLESVTERELDCDPVQTFTYAIAYARFCPAEEVLEIRAADGDLVKVREGAIGMGEAEFVDWKTKLPEAVLGLAGNMEGRNRTGMSPVVDQLSPEHLSFRFPDGGLEDGTLSFGPLPDDRLEGVEPVPLVGPGSLGYGYTAEVERMEFLGDGELLAAIVFEDDGVFLELGSARDRIAEQHLAFFDTGTPVPLVFSNGDVSLLGDDIVAGNIGTDTSGPFYDELRVVFEGASGGSVVLRTDELAPFRAGNPSAVVPTRAEFPEGMKMLASVIGYPLLTQQDFQIDFEGTTAKEIFFVER